MVKGGRGTLPILASRQTFATLRGSKLRRLPDHDTRLAAAPTHFLPMPHCLTFSHPPRRNSRNGLGGFTLVELLVVIAVIAILAALIFPVTGIVRRKGQQTTSMHNLRQWGAALAASLSDNNNFMPWPGQPIARSDSAAWYNRLPVYLGTQPFSAMKTGQFPRAGEKSVWINPAVPLSVNADYSPYLFCYAMNAFLSTPDERTLSMSRVERPSATVFMADKNDDSADCHPSYIKAYHGSGDISSDPDNMAHFLFCDGHVALVARKDFDPEFGAQSMQDNPPDSSFTFSPYTVTVDPNE